MYETGKMPTFRSIVQPFDKLVLDFIQDKTIFVHTEFSRLCERVTDIYGRVRILVHVNDVEHVARCTFLEEDPRSETRTVTHRLPKLECINDYLSETAHQAEQQARLFQEDHDIDLLHYYDAEFDDGQGYVRLRHFAHS
jgi:hypothetical protein